MNSQPRAARWRFASKVNECNRLIAPTIVAGMRRQGKPPRYIGLHCEFSFQEKVDRNNEKCKGDSVKHDKKAHTQYTRR